MLAQIKFVVIGPNLSELQWIIPSAYNMVIKPTFATAILKKNLWSQFLHVRNYFN